MNKKIIVIILIALIALVIATIFWQLFGAEKNTAEENKGQEVGTGINESQEAGNETGINETEAVEPESTEPLPDDSVPNPPGSIRGVDIRNDADGGYYCNNNTNPKHAVRLYTYRIINGVQTLSDSYIESAKVEDVCGNYPESIESTIRYDMKWQWNSAEGIDGYKIYQYYYPDIENVTTRDFDYYIEISKIANQLIDTGLNLWRLEKKEDASNSSS